MTAVPARRPAAAQEPVPAARVSAGAREPARGRRLTLAFQGFSGLSGR